MERKKVNLYLNSSEKKAIKKAADKLNKHFVTFVRESALKEALEVTQ